jgi:sensor domain CHASE-containing protein
LVLRQRKITHASFLLAAIIWLSLVVVVVVTHTEAAQEPEDCAQQLRQRVAEVVWKQLFHC